MNNPPPGQPLQKKRYFELSDEQRIAWLRLMRSQNVGPVTFRDLISHYGSAAAAIEALPELARRGGAAARIQICPREAAEREISLAQKIGARFIALGEPDYPQIMRMSEHSPPILCVRGNAQALSCKSVSIVGSRNASIAGNKLAQRYARELGSAGYFVVSGLARGIDTAAHRAALETGTVAVFAGGVDHVFPDENRDLARTILDNSGAIVSEMPIGWQPRAKDFPRRNRIITALSLAVVIVEAARRSGSLITARLANEMGRLVLAVPGSPLDPRSEGTNGLIKQGATLITRTEDILNAIQPMEGEASEFIYDINEEDDSTPIEGKTVMPQKADDKLRAEILSALSQTPTDVDDILRFTGASTGQLQLILLELALAGRLERHSGNRVSIIS